MLKPLPARRWWLLEALDGSLKHVSFLVPRRLLQVVDAHMLYPCSDAAQGQREHLQRGQEVASR